MEYLLGVLIVILFPAFMVAGPLFPLWWIGRCRRLRREGRWDAVREYDGNWKRFAGRVVAISYAALAVLVVLIGFGSYPVWYKLDRLLLPGVILAGVLLIADMAILMAFSPDRAVELRREEERRG